MAKTASRKRSVHTDEFSAGMGVVLKRYKQDISGEEVYACDLCDFISPRASNLKRHVNIHTKEKQVAAKEYLVAAKEDLVAAKEHLVNANWFQVAVKEEEDNEDVDVVIKVEPQECDKCCYTTSEGGELKEHLKTHTAEGPASDEDENAAQTEPVQTVPLKKRGRPRTVKKTHKCNYCDYTSLKLCNLLRHKRTHPWEKPYACHQCDFRGTHSHFLQEHLKTHFKVKLTHRTSGVHACDHCSYLTLRAYDLKRHIRSHTGERPFPCGQCDYRAIQACHLKDHIRLVHNAERLHEEKLNSYKRDQWGYNAEEDDELKPQTGDEPTMPALRPGTVFMCDLCDFGSAKASTLKNHIATHAVEEDYKAANTADLQYHKKTQADCETYSCDQCDYITTTSSNLSKHKRVHSGEKPHVCDKCGYSARVAGTLKKHIESKHPKNNSERIDEDEDGVYLNCDLCAFKTVVVSNLKQHMLTHIERETHVDDASCSRIVDCTTHKEPVIFLDEPKSHDKTHIMENPYACPDCDYRAGQTIHLKEHMRIHTGEKPYVCDQCDYRAMKPFSLKRHKTRKHTADDPLDCS